MEVGSFLKLFTEYHAGKKWDLAFYVTINADLAREGEPKRAKRDVKTSAARSFYTLGHFLKKNMSFDIFS